MDLKIDSIYIVGLETGDRGERIRKDMHETAPKPGLKTSAFEDWTLCVWALLYKLAKPAPSNKPDRDLPAEPESCWQHLPLLCRAKKEHTERHASAWVCKSHEESLVYCKLVAMTAGDEANGFKVALATVFIRYGQHSFIERGAKNHTESLSWQRRCFCISPDQPLHEFDPSTSSTTDKLNSTCLHMPAQLCRSASLFSCVALISPWWMWQTEHFFNRLLRIVPKHFVWEVSQMKVKYITCSGYMIQSVWWQVSKTWSENDRPLDIIWGERGSSCGRGLVSATASL